MSAVSAQPDGDGIARVSLADLIAVRARVGKAVTPPDTARAQRAGPQASRLHGRGMDYAESRIYQGGDDVRRLDWRLTARSGRLHTKLFQEEREGRLMIAVDTHASMRFATRGRFKSVQAARAAAWAAWHAAKAGERIGLVGFGARDEVLAPRPGAHGALVACGALAQWDQAAAAEPSGRSEPLSAVLQRLGRMLHGASRVLLITDGQCCDEASRRWLLDLSRRLRLIVVTVSDALEREPLPPGRYPLAFGRERREWRVDAAAGGTDLRDRLAAGRMRLEAMARAGGIAIRDVDTVGDPFDVLAALAGPRRRA